MSKGPKDINQTAFDVIAQALGEPTSTVKQRASAGGKARAEKLTKEQRSEIARNAAARRWHKQEPEDRQ